MLRRILLTTDAVGGVWRYSLEMAQGFSAHGAETVLAVLGPKPNAAQVREAEAVLGLRLVVTGLPLDWLAETPDELEAAAEALARLAGQVRADTVQLHAPALCGRVPWPVPVVAVAHSCVGTWWSAVREGPLPLALAWRANATSVGMQRANAIVAPSVSFRQALFDRYDSACSIEVVLNGRNPVRAVAERRNHALTAGRLWDDGKNVAVLDVAAGLLDWAVCAAGPVSGPNGASVTCRHLQLLGSLNEATLAQHYAQASMFVSVALYEPFGLAVLEAAQAGCALVLSDIPTFRELWDGVATFVPAGHPGRIAEALDTLFRDPERRATLGGAAKDRTSALSAARMVDGTLAVHRKVASRCRTAA